VTTQLGPRAEIGDLAGLGSLAAVGLFSCLRAARTGTTQHRRDRLDDLGSGQFVDAKRTDMRGNYDYTLIDSRAGQSNIAGIVRRSTSMNRDRGVRILLVPRWIDEGDEEKADIGRILALGFLSGLGPAELSRYWTAPRSRTGRSTRTRRARPAEARAYPAARPGAPTAGYAAQHPVSPEWLNETAFVAWRELLDGAGRCCARTTARRPRRWSPGPSRSRRCPEGMGGRRAAPPAARPSAASQPVEGRCRPRGVPGAQVPAHQTGRPHVPGEYDH
jgi:hypothetical protein